MNVTAETCNITDELSVRARALTGEAPRKEEWSWLCHIKTFVYQVSNESFQVSLRILPHTFRLFTVFPQQWRNEYGS